MTDLSEDDSDWIVGEGLARRRHAQDELTEVELLLANGHPDAAEAAARRSLASFASSLNWLEDTEEFDTAHQLLDLAGAYVRRTFGCTIHWTGSGYEQRCPVAVAHKRIGVSPEIVVDGWDCTICNADAETCEHIVGRFYEGEMCGRRARGPIRLLGIAWVTRPDQPDARLTALPLSTDEIRAKMPPDWRPGMPLACDRCLLPCDGIEEFDFAELQQLASDGGAEAAPSEAA
jgi:hypothetical protein